MFFFVHPANSGVERIENPGKYRKCVYLKSETIEIQQKPYGNHDISWGFCDFSIFQILTPGGSGRADRSEIKPPPPNLARFLEIHNIHFVDRGGLLFELFLCLNTKISLNAKMQQP